MKILFVLNSIHKAWDDEVLSFFKEGQIHAVVVPFRFVIENGKHAATKIS